MDYQETLRYIWGIKKFTDKVDLKTMEHMMRNLGDPQRGLRIVHVAGTNGKGSVCNYIAASLTAAGYRTGLYLSPFLEVFNERIRVDGRLISDQDIVRLAAKVKPAAEKTESVCGRFPKQFEFVTAMAFLYFAEQKCDYVVLEAGMGGELDATNIIENPLLSVITSIGLDHTAILGNTVEQIARKKSGIIKAGCPVVCDPFMDERAYKVIQQRAGEMGSPFLRTAPETLAIEKADMEGLAFRYRGEDYRIQMLGEYQAHNSVLAIEALAALGIPLEAVKSGVASVRFPGRLERILPNAVVDGAHNEMGIESLTDALRFHRFPEPSFVVSIGREKDYEKMLDRLIEAGEKSTKFYFTSFDQKLAADPEELCRFTAAKSVDSTVLPTVCSAVELLLNPKNQDKFYVLCGSLYLIGSVKNELKRRKIHRIPHN